MDSRRAREERAHPRSKSPHRHSHKRKRSVSPQHVVLPFNSRQLKKDDYNEHRPLFALYLDVQKTIVIDGLDEHEAKGRWKSFMKKWNCGDLAEGWYDPATKQKADTSSPRPPSTSSPNRRRPSPDYSRKNEAAPEEDSDEDEFGPALPSKTSLRAASFVVTTLDRKAGPAIPNLQDLEFRDELRTEDHLAAREELAEIRNAERNAQKERLEELVPRADPGSRERKLEKKKEVTTTVASFRDAKEGGTEEVAEGDLMGDDGVEGYKKQKMEAEKKKSERELRKEELWRVRAEERADRLRAHKEKEDKTMDMFKKLAQQRFG